MKTLILTFTIAACALALTGTARAGESVAGTWKARFDSQIGVQKYTYVFKVDGTNVTGTATAEREMGTNTVAIADGTFNKGVITFVEPLDFQGQEISIKYEGKISGDEIKFTRHVGDFATEKLVAHRVRRAGVSSGMNRTPAAGTNVPPAKL